KPSTQGCRRPPSTGTPTHTSCRSRGTRSGASVCGCQTAWSAVSHAAAQLGVAAKNFVAALSGGPFTGITQELDGLSPGLLEAQSSPPLLQMIFHSASVTRL